MARGAEQQQQGDHSMAPLWIAAGILILGYVLWHFAHTQVAFVILKIKLFEASAIGMFTQKIQPLIAQIKAMPPSQASGEELLDLSTRVGEFLRYPVIALLTLFGGILYFSNSVADYCKVYSMKSLLNQEKENWPQVAPISKLDLVAQDLDQGEWASSMPPMMFAKKNDLLVEKKSNSEEEDLLLKRPTRVGIVRDKATRAFSLQLGRFWTKLDDLRIYEKALVAVFLAKANRDKSYETILAQISASAGESGQLDFSGVEALLEKYKHDKLLTKLTKQHAYVYTLLASLLQESRFAGVLATAEFLWLKPVDRELWYMLNSIGRQTAFSEIAGAFAHWLAECKIGHALHVPMVSEAVIGLEQAVQEIIYHRDEEEVSA